MIDKRNTTTKCSRANSRTKRLPSFAPRLRVRSKGNARCYEGTSDHAYPVVFLVAVFDIDGGGTIESNELKTVMTKLGDNPTDEEIQDMILLVDENGDNEIDFDEFR